MVKAIREPENGRKAEEICRDLGSSNVTYYKWRQKYGGLEVSELKIIKELEEENSNWDITITNPTINVVGDKRRSIYLQAI